MVTYYALWFIVGHSFGLMFMGLSYQNFMSFCRNFALSGCLLHYLGKTTHFVPAFMDWFYFKECYFSPKPVPPN